jgi:hypothetical protein
MSEFQVVTALATLLGITATVLNLVAFVREKDKGHTRAGLAVLFLLVLVLAILFLPRYMPRAARGLASAVPASIGRALEPWLASGSSRGSERLAPAVQDASAGMLGSFTIEIQRNLLGGIGALVSNFQFSNPADRAVRVSAYHLRITRQTGEAAHSYDRVLAQPLTVPAGGTAATQVELDAEIRDQWVAREELEAAGRGPIEVSWECQSLSGQSFRLTSSNG